MFAKSIFFFQDNGKIARFLQNIFLQMNSDTHNTVEWEDDIYAILCEFDVFM